MVVIGNSHCEHVCDARVKGFVQTCRGHRDWRPNVGATDAELQKDTTAAVYVVKRIDTVVKQEVYNPFTLGGTIIVNGVVASSHSD